jgi:hypothetical protein
VESGELLAIDLLYGDHDGGQRMISRFVLERRGEGPSQQWIPGIARHWNLNRPDPREWHPIVCARGRTHARG